MSELNRQLDAKYIKDGNVSFSFNGGNVQFSAQKRENGWKHFGPSRIGKDFDTVDGCFEAGLSYINRNTVKKSLSDLWLYNNETHKWEQPE